MNALGEVNASRLNDARWAACNVWWPEEERNGVPSMEMVTRIADAAIATYLGLDEDEWEAVQVKVEKWAESL